MYRLLVVCSRLQMRKSQLRRQNSASHLDSRFGNCHAHSIQRYATEVGATYFVPHNSKVARSRPCTLQEPRSFGTPSPVHEPVWPSFVLPKARPKGTQPQKKSS